VARVTTVFEAKNEILPELIKTRKETTNINREFGRLGSEAGRTGRNMGQSFRAMQRDAERMQREIRSVRSELSRLGSMNEKPRVTLDDQASQQIESIRQKLIGLGGLAAGVAIGTNVGDAMTEIEAAFRERALYAARGKTAEEMQLFDQRSKELLQVNPFLTRSEAMNVLTRSEQYNRTNAGEYAEVSAKLGVTTRYAPEDHLRMMAIMKENTGVDDAVRLANSIQYMANNLRDFRDEFVDSIIEYSVQTSKFLDTPEKMAALVAEIGRMGIWSDDKALDALKEATLKLTNEGDLTNVLKTGYETMGMESKDAMEKAAKEASEINRLLQSANEADNQAAMGRMMMTLATIQDRNVRQQVLNELGAGPGEDLGRHFAPLLEFAGRLSTGEIEPKVGNELEKAYNLAVANNPLFEFQKAQNEAKQAVLDLGAKIAEDVTPALVGLSESAKWVTERFNALPDWGRYTLEIAGAAGALGGGALMLIRAAYLQMAAARMLSGGGKGSVPLDFGGGTGDGSNRKNRRRLWNPRTWFGGGDKTDPAYWLEKWSEKEQKRVARKERWGWLNPFNWKSKKVEEIPFKGLDYSNIGLGKRWSVDPVYKQYEIEKILSSFRGSPSRPSAADRAIEASLEPPKSFGGGLIRKIPWVGAAVGLGQILTAENKLEAAGRVGTEALGGWGGAAAGAAIGSIIPGVGTVVGGIVGGIVGAFGGGAIFDKVKSWWNSAPEKPEENIRAQEVKPISAPAASPAKSEEKPKLASLTVQNMPITLRADGVLQDIPTLVRMLNSPEVKRTINRNVEQAFIDALETRGGVR